MNQRITTITPDPCGHAHCQLHLLVQLFKKKKTTKLTGNERQEEFMFVNCLLVQ